MESVDDVIQTIGRKRLADILNVGDTAISNAKKNGLFPAAWYMLISAALGDKGFDCPVAIFNFRNVSDAA